MKHSKLMGLRRTTDRSAGPVVRMDGGTGKKRKKPEILKFATAKLKKKHRSY